MVTARVTLVGERPDEARAKTVESKLSNPATASDFDLYGGVNEVLKDVGMTVADGGGKLTFYGQDPIIPSRFRFGSMAAIGLAATSVAGFGAGEDPTGGGPGVSRGGGRGQGRGCR